MHAFLIITLSGLHLKAWEEKKHARRGILSLWNNNGLLVIALRLFKSTLKTT